MKVIVLRGVAGSGKSTWVRANFPGVTALSADQYFERGGKYAFDPAKIGAAHADCLRRFVDFVQAWCGSAETTVVVDNTGTTIAEVAPYAALALAYGDDLEVVTLRVDPKVAAARNVHGVPLDVVEAMAADLDANTAMLPPWWPHRVVEG